MFNSNPFSRLNVTGPTSVSSSFSFDFVIVSCIKHFVMLCYVMLCMCAVKNYEMDIISSSKQ